MDVLAAAITVIQLLQVTAQVSIALGQYAAAVRGAESSRSKLVDQKMLISAAARAIEYRPPCESFKNTCPTFIIYYRSVLRLTVKHESTREQRQRTTGEWLVNEDLYVESGLIDSLSSGLADDETLAYFYCDFRNPRSTSTMEILRSLTTQLLWTSKIDGLSSFPELIVRNERGTGPPGDVTTLSDLLRCAAKSHQRPMIVIDAPDEWDDLSKLLDELVKLDGRSMSLVHHIPAAALYQWSICRSIDLPER
ncbi:hypothetical protein BU15DRAFT_83360 [Melanogaster broomeanus]|nr:hypothetical protein BU15DRAFT_83360 [Melanogaster broomeanus]